MREVKIEAVELDQRCVRCTLSDGTVLVQSFVWLRDHALDALSFDAGTHQRMYETSKMDLDIKPLSVSVSESQYELEIEWPDHDALIVYALAELLGSAFAHIHTVAPSHAVSQPWQVAPDSTLEYAQALDSNDVQLLSQLARYGFVHIKNCPVGLDSVACIANRIGYVRQTHYGGVWHFEADQSMADSAYSMDALRSHTDGTYYHDAPGLQLLMCLEEGAEGGESLLTDGLAVVEDLQTECPDVFDALCRINVTGIYKGDGRVMRATRPIIRMNGDVVEQISYNNYDRDRLTLPPADESLLYKGIVEFERRANKAERQWVVKLKPGEMIVFDNWRILHGRTAFSGHRKMAGCYINRDEYQSCLRRSL